MSAKKTILILAMIIFITSIATEANTMIYVDANAAGDNNGSSWQNAYKYLQDALVAAQDGNSHQIWVAAGTYKPDRNSANPNGSGDRTATFNLINNVTLYGGFPTGGGAWEIRDSNIYETVLSGDLAGNDRHNIDPCDLLNDPTRAENSYHVVTAAGDINMTAVLDGFTITGTSGGGMINGGSPTMANCLFSRNSADRGGGMYLSKSNSTITNCTFSENFACYSGGGMYNDSGSPTIINCLFEKNTSVGAVFPTDGGGGMYNGYNSSPTITNCTFSENAAYYGGGICSDSDNPIITNCTFIKNSAYYSGGGMLKTSGNLTITNCTFSENTADSGYGGGMWSGVNNLTVANCNFSGNSASGYGGGMYHLSATLLEANTMVTNCTFSGNSANKGGGMYDERDSIITNCMFNGNSAHDNLGRSSGDGGGIYNFQNNTIITNCTFSKNSADSNGGGMCNYWTYIATITNCTFSENSAGHGGGICCVGAIVEIANCILYNDVASQGNEMALLWRYDSLEPADSNCSIAGVSYSDVNGGPAGVYNQNFHGQYCSLYQWDNIDKDPCFVSPGHWDSNGTPGNTNDDLWVDGNYRLREGSPCIDAGDNSSVPPDYADLDKDGNKTELTPLDLGGCPRFVDGDNDGNIIVDMGAYEFGPCECRYSLVGDLNGDCRVDFQDLKIMAESWLERGPVADIEPPSGDGIVNFRDFAVLAENWLIDCMLTPSNPACK